MKKVVALVLVAFLIVGGVGGQTKKPKSVKQLKSKLSDVHEKQHDARVKLKKVQHNIRVVKGTLEEVNARIERVSDELETTATLLDRNKREQGRLKEQLTVATHQLQERTEEARHRLKMMRMKGQSSFISALVGSRSVGELASRRYLFERIAMKDRALFTEVKELREEVESKVVRQTALVKETTNLLGRQKTQKYELAESRADQGALLAQLRDKEGDLKKLIQDLDNEESSIQATIDSFMRNPANTAGLVRPSGRLLMPVPGADIGIGFGMGFQRMLHINRMQKGLDLGARSGTPIHAAADGVVVTSTRQRGFGNVIILAHGGGISTLYGHCSVLLKSTGQHVKKGEVIARVGSTGLSTGPHCHFEVHVGGRAVNPKAWL